MFSLLSTLTLINAHNHENIAERMKLKRETLTLEQKIITQLIVRVNQICYGPAS